MSAEPNYGSAGFQIGAGIGRAPLAALDAAAALGRSPGSMHLQTAVLLQPNGAVQSPGLQVGGGLRPLYREMSFNLAAMAAQAQAEDALVDPFLERHLAERLDDAMLAAAHRFAGDGAPRLHLDLSVAGVLSNAFSAVAGRVVSLGIELSLAEAGADPQGFATACELVVASGMILVLDRVPATALLLCRPERLGVDLMKVDWTAGLATPANPALAEAIAEFGPDRIVLNRADTEAALHWGRGHGIRRFQGRHVDAMLAASRILVCPAAAVCTLPQCMERAAATMAVARRGCGNPVLLDAGVVGP